MQRDIVFRGQTRKFGEKVNMNGDKLSSKWVYGGIFYGKGDFSIIYGGEPGNEIEKHVVYTNTVGQYTTQDDDSDTKKRIYDGDILAVYDREDSLHYIPNPLELVATAIVSWDESRWIATEIHSGEVYDLYDYGGEKRVVIGNIHDNPEMIGGAI